MEGDICHYKTKLKNVTKGTVTGATNMFKKIADLKMVVLMNTKN